MRVNALGPIWVTEALLPMFESDLITQSSTTADGGCSEGLRRAAVLFLGSVCDFFILFF
jgi:hypothetical protein